MSAYTTLRITRSRAKVKVMDFILGLEDDDLQDIMDRILEPRLYNCRVVDDGSTDNDDDII